MPTIPALSIVVPTLNEADNVLPLLASIDGSMRKAKILYEVIFIDDHSSDATIQNITNAMNYYPINLQLKQGKRGKAYSLHEGFKLAQYNYICMIDADLQYPPDAIVPMLDLIIKRNADVVITNRINHETSIIRKLSSKIFNFFFVKLLFGFNYDTQSGLKVFKKDILNYVTFNSGAWSFDLEFIVRSLENNFKILSYTIPFNARFSGEAKIKLIDSTYELIVESLKLRLTTSGKKIKKSYHSNIKFSKEVLDISIVFILITAITFVLNYKKSEALPLISDSKTLSSLLQNTVSSPNITLHTNQPMPLVMEGSTPDHTTTSVVPSQIGYMLQTPYTTQLESNLVSSSSVPLRVQPLSTTISINSEKSDNKINAITYPMHTNYNKNNLYKNDNFSSKNFVKILSSLLIMSSLVVLVFKKQIYNMVVAL
ncbi:MAG: hypothetical protein NVSMB46_06180 [Candidatus Saccharimonadales bacterium]